MRLITALIFAFCFTSLSFQTKVHGQGVELQPGSPIERTLKSGESHSYTATLEENTFLQLAVEQRGIDVVIHITSPEGKTIGQFDTPNGIQGVEDVSFVATTPGIYTIIVFPLQSLPAPSAQGRYEIKILDRRPATSDELKSLKNIEVNALKSKALLKDLVASIAQLKSPAGRIRFQLSLSSIVEQGDRKLSNEMLDAAIASFTDLAASVNEDDDDYPGAQYSIVGQLRNEIVQAVAPRDPEKALVFLNSSRSLLERQDLGRGLDEYSEMSFKLIVASQLSKVDPKRTFQMAQEVLKKQYASGLATTLESLTSTSPELAQQLENQIIQKLSDETILQNAEAAQLATTLLQSTRTSSDQGQQSGLLSADARDRIFQKLLTEALAYKPTNDPATYQYRSIVWGVLETLKNVGPSINKTENAAAVEKKFAELVDKMNPQYRLMQGLQENLNNGSVEQSLEEVDKAPVEVRQQMYQSVAEKAAAAGEVDKAEFILTDRIVDKFQRHRLFRNLEQQRVFQLVAKGNSEEALRVIRSMPSPKSQSLMIAQIAAQIGAGLKRSVVLSLLEQARSILGVSSKAKSPEEMAALLELGKAFAKYDSYRATEIIQPLLDQFNDLDAAFNIIRTFAQPDGSNEAYYPGMDFVTNVGQQLPSAIGQVALKDFDRAKSLADRINAPELRISMYIEMVRTTFPTTANN